METTSKRKSGTTDLTVGKPLFQIQHELDQRFHPVTGLMLFR